MNNKIEKIVLPIDQLSKLFIWWSIKQWWLITQKQCLTVNGIMSKGKKI